MRKELLEILNCPICGMKNFTLSIVQKNAMEIREGSLKCRECSTVFTIKKGIIDLLVSPGDSIIREQRGWVEMHQDEKYRNDDEMLDIPWCRNHPESRDFWRPFAENFSFVLNKLNLKGMEHVLDLGAGRCWSTREFAKKGCYCIAYDILQDKYVGLETSDIYFKNLKSGYFERILGDMNSLPFDDNTFDVVFSSATLHHSSDINNAFKEISKVLKPNGRVVLINEPVVGFLESKRPKGPEVEYGINENLYTYWEWIRAMRKSGLNPNVYISPSLSNMLETGNIKGKKYKQLVGRIVSSIWRIKSLRPIVKNLHIAGMIIIGMDLLVIARKS